MLEKNVIGTNCLEGFDSKTIRRKLQPSYASNEALSHEQVVEAHTGKLPTHCDHGVPVHEYCELCRAFLG
jgi:hypothetical protein